MAFESEQQQDSLTTRQFREQEYALRYEQVLRQQGRLRKVIQKAARKEVITTSEVYAYAALHLRTENGTPIQPAPHHKLWMKLICDERIKRLLIIAPPESAKTTWVVSAYCGLYMGVWPQRSIIIGSVSGPVAEKRSMSLRATVEDENWKTTFPGLRRVHGLPWRTHEWSLAPDGIPHPGRLHPTLAAYGTGGSVIGSRADLVIADDLLNQENSRTPGSRAFVEAWMHQSLLSRRKSGTGRAVVIGTAWHHDDLYANLKRAGGWVVCHVPLLSESERVIATLTYPDEFEGEMLGKPVGSRELAEELAEENIAA